jgi:hypothetical protein
MPSVRVRSTTEPDNGHEQSPRAEHDHANDHANDHDHDHDHDHGHGHDHGHDHGHGHGHGHEAGMTGDGFVTAARCATEDAARALAVRLVEQGIGATIARLPAPPTTEVADEHRPFAVQVLPTDEVRAAEVLGVEIGGLRAEAREMAEGGETASVAGPGGSAVGPGPMTPGVFGATGPDVAAALEPAFVASVAADEHETEVAIEQATSWKRVLLIWGIAMVMVPLVAGLITFFVLSR